MRLFLVSLFILIASDFVWSRNIPSIEMADIPAGSFFMGGRGDGEDFDESPVHKVVFPSSFRMSVTEITNLQYECFFPEHKSLRGDKGVSINDNDAVVNVSWNDAVEFCKRLSQATGRKFRLPTEAEWEYACRGGSYTLFNTGDWFPDSMHKEQRVARDFSPISLKVAQFAPNKFGLYDMHGNVEEWCMDYYALYSPCQQVSPCGPSEGIYRVTRGGSHHTPVKYLRSSNRSAMLPDDRHAQTGFRIVESDVELNNYGECWVAPKKIDNISSLDCCWNPVNSDKPFYVAPVPYVIRPNDIDAIFYRHNHQPAVTWCKNGDLLAIWFSSNDENGREVTVLYSRRDRITGQWDEAREFFRVPDRNVTGSSLITLADGTILHINGIEASGDWQNLAMVCRKSIDNGVSWTKPEIIAPLHEKRHQVIAGPIVTSQGYILQPCDAGPGGNDGTALHISFDAGKSWHDQWDGSELPDFIPNGRGTTIAGIHAGVVQLDDSTLLAMGRGNSIADSAGVMRMPVSISHDMGKTWTYSASPFTPIDGGQRLVLRRLNEGPLLLVSFTGHPLRTAPEHYGMEFTAADGSKFIGYGMFAALSFDNGKTWPIRKLISDSQTRYLDGGAWTGGFVSDSIHAEPRGYLCATQTPDNVIHLLSSRLHYQFNLAWLLQAPDLSKLPE